MDKCNIRPWEWDDDQVITACLDYRTKSEIRDRNPSAYVCISYRDLWDRLTWLRGKNSRREGRITNEEIIEKSKEYKGEGRGAFQTAEPSLYAAAYRRGLLDSMPWLDDAKGRTTTQLLELSKQFNSLKDFKQADLSAYIVLRKRGALDAITWFDVDETKTDEELADHRAFIESIRNGTTDELIAQRAAEEKARLEAIPEPLGEEEGA